MQRLHVSVVFLMLLVAPVVVEAIPATGSYDLTLSGDTNGSGYFNYDADTGLVTNFFVSIGLLEGVLDLSFWSSNYLTCFVEWSLSPTDSSCASSPTLKGFGSGGSALSITYNLRRDNTATFLNSSIADPTSDLGYARYDVTYSAALRSVPEPGTLVLFGLGLFGLGFSRRELN